MSEDPERAEQPEAEQPESEQPEAEQPEPDQRIAVRDRGSRRFGRSSGSLRALMTEPAAPRKPGRVTRTFKAIVLGEEPEIDTIYDDEFAVAYHDPDAAGALQVIVMPRLENVSFADYTAQANDAALAGFMRAVGEVVRKLGLHMGAYHMLVDQRVRTDQELPSFHLVITKDTAAQIPRRKAPVEDERALVLVPLGAEPSKSQIRVLAEELELDAYDAGQALRTPFPRVLRKGFAYETDRLIEHLKPHGIELRSLETSKLLQAIDPWPVKTIDLVDGELVLEGPEGKVTLEADRKGRLIQGRYSWSRKKVAEGVLSSAPKRGKSSGRLPKVMVSRFAHLYPTDQPRPYSFVESELHDYHFLGEEMAPSGNLNFNKLIEKLVTSEVEVIDVMARSLPVVITTAVAPLWLGVERPKTHSPDLDAELLSRLIHCTAESG